MSDKFDLYLFSNASLDTYPGNTLSSFTNVISGAVSFRGHGTWQLALASISVPSNTLSNTTVLSDINCSIITPNMSNPETANVIGSIIHGGPKDSSSSSSTSVISASTCHIQDNLMFYDVNSSSLGSIKIDLSDASDGKGLKLAGKSFYTDGQRLKEHQFFSN